VPRTRLTHSLEVAQIGRGIAEELGCDPDVVDTGGLAHDIGHPPFGHNGEQALDAAAQPCGGFEGNAQTLRILTRLEPKVVGGGLNLTRACLDASCKYPWPRDVRDPSATRTYGVYRDDLEVFGWLRDGAPERRRCLEAQVMDWSDDVAYSVHDLEDGIRSGRIVLAALGDPAERAALAGLAAASFGADEPAGEDAAKRLLALPAVEDALGYDATAAALVALKRLTSELVGRFAVAAVDATQATYGTAPLARYAADLVVPPEVRAEVVLLKAVALRYVMSDPERMRLQSRQRELLAELVDALVRTAPDSLEPAMAEAWLAAGTDAQRLRAVIDQVAMLTDQQAVAWHARWCGRPVRPTP
jgi:dGTPase